MSGYFNICVVSDLSPYKYQFFDTILLTITMAWPMKTHNRPCLLTIFRVGDDISPVRWIAVDSCRKCKDQVSQIVPFASTSQILALICE